MANKNDIERKVLFVINAQLFSQFGSALTGFALGVWLYRNELNTSSISLLYFFQSLPSIFFALIAGWLVDSYSKKKILIYCDIAFILLLAGLLVGYLSGRMTASILYIYVACCTLCSIMQTIALTAFTGSVLDDKKKVTFNTKINLRKTLPRLLAPLLAGAIVQYSHLLILIIVDFITFIISLVATFMLPDIGVSQHRTEKGSIPESSSGYYLSAIKFILRQPEMLYSILSLQLSVIGVSLLGVYIIPLTLAQNSSLVSGLIIAFGALGAILGSRTMRRKSQSHPDIFLSVSVLAQGVTVIACCLVPNIILLSFLIFMYFFFVPAQNGCGNAIWQHKVRQGEYGRILSIQGLIVQITAIITLFSSGILVDKLLTPMVASGHFNFYHELPPNIASIYLVLILFGFVELCVGLILTAKTIVKVRKKDKSSVEYEYARS